MDIAAYIGLGLLALLTLFQLALIAGTPLGQFAWGGKHKVLPRNLRFASASSILLYGIFAVFLASKAGFVDWIWQEPVLSVGMWVLFGYFVLGVLMNLISRSKKERALMTPVALALAVVFFVVAIGAPTVAQDPINKRSFTFDQASASGWWTGGNYWPDPAEYSVDAVTVDELPIASLNATQGTRETPGECFVMAFYQKGSVDVAAELKEREAGMVLGITDLSVLNQIDSQNLTMHTPDGRKDYELHQYVLGLPDIQQGNAFGFIPLDDGYVEVRSICTLAEQLPSSHAGLAAISLKD